MLALIYIVRCWDQPPSNPAPQPAIRIPRNTLLALAPRLGGGGYPQEPMIRRVADRKLEGTGLAGQVDQLLTGLQGEECLDWETVTARAGQLSRDKAGDGRVTEACSVHDAEDRMGIYDRKKDFGGEMVGVRGKRASDDRRSLRR